MPWLLTGGTLVLHHPFAPAVFARQRADERCTVAVLPGPMVMRLADAGLIGADDRTVLAVWRAPERLAASAAWRGSATLIDIPVFGEIGLIASRRGARRQAGRDSDRPSRAPRGSAQGMHVLTVARTPAGTIALSGPMVPHAPFPPGAERGGAPRLKITDGSDRHRLSLPRRPRHQAADHRRPARRHRQRRRLPLRAARRCRS